MLLFPQSILLLCISLWLAVAAVLLQRVTRVTGAQVGALCVDARVVAELALVQLALVQVAQALGPLHRVLRILRVPDGERLLGVRAV